MADHYEDSVIVYSLVWQALVSAQEVKDEYGLCAALRASGLERFIGTFSPNNLNPVVKTVDYARFNEVIGSFYGRGVKDIL